MRPPTFSLRSVWVSATELISVWASGLVNAEWSVPKSPEGIWGCLPTEKKVKSRKAQTPLEGFKSMFETDVVNSFLFALSRSPSHLEEYSRPDGAEVLKRDFEEFKASCEKRHASAKRTHFARKLVAEVEGYPQVEGSPKPLRVKIKLRKEYKKMSDGCDSYELGGEKNKPICLFGLEKAQLIHFVNVHGGIDWLRIRLLFPEGEMVELPVVAPVSIPSLSWARWLARDLTRGIVVSELRERETEYREGSEAVASGFADHVDSHVTSRDTVMNSSDASTTDERLIIIEDDSSEAFARTKCSEVQPSLTTEAKCPEDLPPQSVSKSESEKIGHTQGHSTLTSSKWKRKLAEKFYQEESQASGGVATQRKIARVEW